MRSYEQFPRKSFRMRTYKKHRGWGAVPLIQELIILHSSLATILKSFLFTLLRTLLRFFALTKNSTLLFSSDSALFAKNTRGWG